MKIPVVFSNNAEPVERDEDCDSALDFSLGALMEKEIDKILLYFALFAKVLSKLIHFN